MKAMSARPLLDELTRLGVTMHADGGKLLFIDPKRALTPALRGALRTNRAALLAELAGRPSSHLEVAATAVEVVPAADGKGARLVVREDGRIAGAVLSPIELAELAEQLMEAGGRAALAKRQGVL